MTIYICLYINITSFWSSHGVTSAHKHTCMRVWQVKIEIEAPLKIEKIEMQVPLMIEETEIQPHLSL